MYQFQRKYFYLLAISLCCMLPTPAFAYVEPGTGNLILQLLFGGFAGIGLLFKLYWRNLSQALGKYKATSRDNSQTQSAQENDVE